VSAQTAHKIAEYRERTIREHILEAARTAFAASGHAAHVRDIVGAGDFSLSTLYRYFPEGKDQIVVDLFARMVAEVGADMERVAAIEDTREALEAWMDVGFEQVDRYGLLASSLATGNLPELHRDLLPVADLYRFTGRLIKRAIEQRQLAAHTPVRDAVRVWFALVVPGRIRGCLRDGLTIREIRDLTLGYFFRLFAQPGGKKKWGAPKTKR
jgi:AcrR family transcriptional regulator